MPPLSPLLLARGRRAAECESEQVAGLDRTALVFRTRTSVTNSIALGLPAHRQGLTGLKERRPMRGGAAARHR